MSSLRLTLFGFIAGMLLAMNVLAQGYPARPVKLIVPFPPGSQTDQAARLIGIQLQEDLGQPFIVENKPGAAGAIAAEGVAKSPPDGYTLLVTTAALHAANPSLFKKLSYDPVKDFVPIARISTTSMMLMVRPDFPAKDLEGFVAYVKSQPGKISAGYGSSGAQVALAMLESMANIDVLEIPYKGIPQAVADLLGGSLTFTFVDVGNAVAQSKGGKLRGLGVTSQERAVLAPDVPALGEQFKGFEVISWFGLVAPTGTGGDVIARLHGSVAKALARQEVRDKFIAIGTTPAVMNPSQFSAFIQNEITNWSRLTKLANIKPE